LPAGQMLDDVGELPVGGERADVQLVDGVAEAIALVFRAVRVAGVRRLRHPDAEIADRDHPVDELDRRGGALAIGDEAERERLPRALRDAAVERLAITCPELDAITT